MSYLSDLLKSPTNKFEENQKLKALELIEEFKTRATVRDGVVRWNSNNSVPPTEILNLWRHANHDFDYEKSMAAKDVDSSISIAEYRKSQANRKYTEEEKFEMRAAGLGRNVSNLLSGNKITL